MIKAFDALEDFVLAQAGIFERALLEAVVLDEVGLVLLDEPAVELCLFVKLRARIRRGQRDLQREDVEFLSEADRLLDGFAGLDGQAVDGPKTCTLREGLALKTLLWFRVPLFSVLTKSNRGTNYPVK